MDVPPSPKVHTREVMVPEVMVEASVNTEELLLHPASIEKEGTGNGPAPTFLDILSLQPSAEVTTSFTVKVPTDAYVCVGFCTVDVPPSPKFHAQAVIDPEAMVETSKKSVGTKAQTPIGVKSVTGLG